MRISDWSSDVCSSDLQFLQRLFRRHGAAHGLRTQACKQILAIDELGAGLAGQRLQVADKVARWNVDGLRHAALCGYRHRQRTGHGKDGGAEQSSLSHRCIPPRSAEQHSEIQTPMRKL